jgi:hypothetical protein
VINIEHNDIVLLGYDAVWSCRQIQAFRRNTVSPSSELKYVGEGKVIPSFMDYDVCRVTDFATTD